MTTYDSHYINGAWHKAHNPAVLEVHDSTTEEVMATVSQGTAEEATQAVLAAANYAFKTRPNKVRK